MAMLTIRTGCALFHHCVDSTAAAVQACHYAFQTQARRQTNPLVNTIPAASPIHNSQQQVFASGFYMMNPALKASVEVLLHNAAQLRFANAQGMTGRCSSLIGWVCW